MKINNFIKKIILIVFLLLPLSVFSQKVDWNTYWANELKPIEKSLQILNKNYFLEIEATETDLTIKILQKQDFTKYDNISLSAVIYKGLYKYNPKMDKFKDVKTIYIITYPYIRVIELDSLKNLTDKSFDLGVLISASEIKNEIQQKK